MSVGAFAVCLTNLVSLRTMFAGAVDEATNVQFNFISLSRLFEYTSIPQEQPQELSTDPSLDWMSGGATLQIRDLVAGYGDDPRIVIKGVNLLINAHSKVGVVGTSGCGKSSLLLCILRILEPRSGTIEINGINTNTIGLKTLRRAIGLVAQDPILFSGTVRTNLDPFGESMDETLWAALGKVELKTTVSKMGDGAGLVEEIKAGGDNLSLGQRQLLCVARMIVRRPKLLLLDEATSSIEPRTQEMVQNAIESEFPESTIVAIAHRLETIIKFDTIVVMDQGHIVEKGSAEELSSSKGSIFAQMLSAKKNW